VQGRDTINFPSPILLLARQPYGSQHSTVAGDFSVTWRVADSAHRVVAVSAAAGRSVREVEVIEDAAEDEADQTRPRMSQRAMKKETSSRNALSRFG